MFESHFGLSAPPFQLNPDPRFFFESSVHRHALAFLKFGVYQGEGFIVVTGEIGSGKTTLVKSLLGRLDTERIVAAEITSTQLEPEELLRAVALAFGVKPSGRSKAQTLATLEAFFVAVATGGRRALLIVDEAQNLNPASLEELRMLSNFQVGHHALLQSFLVGQPGLRALLASPELEQLRQRVIAACHVGPLGAQETSAYIEHRLRHAGWTGQPAFAPEAVALIHRYTDGVPRRINVLCSRLMLGACLASQAVVRAGDVESIDRELRAELGVCSIAPLP